MILIRFIKYILFFNANPKSYSDIVTLKSKKKSPLPQVGIYYLLYSLLFKKNPPYPPLKKGGIISHILFLFLKDLSIITNILFPPLKKGGRGDFLVLFYVPLVLGQRCYSERIEESQFLWHKILVRFFAPLRMTLFISLLFIFSISLNANTNNFDVLNDSIVKQFPEIKVEAKAEENNASIKYTSNTKIESDYFNIISPMQLSDIINISPGLFVKNYGGLGGLKTVSIRGTNAQHTLIQLDGITLNSSQNSTFDLSLLPMKIVENISISKGGLSAIYGTGAIGGVIEINTKHSNKLSYKIESKYGSFNDLSTAASVSVPIKNVNISSLLEYQSSKGNYPINVVHFGEQKEVKRENADFENISGCLNANATFDNSELNGFILIRSSERGSPGAVVQGSIENSVARLKEKDLLSSLKYSYFLSEMSNLSFSVYGKLSNFNFVDLDKFTSKIKKTDFTSRDVKFNLSFNLLKKKSNLQVGFEGTFSDLRGNMLQKNVGDYIKRNTIGFYSNYDFQIYNTELLTSNAFTGFRVDGVEKFSPSFSPMLGALISANNFPLELKFTVSSNYRTPSFNEMYYLNYGSTNLKAEKSTSFNIGANSKVFGFKVGLDVFNIITNDLIVSTATSPITWEAMNIKEAISKGIEFAVSNDSIFDFIDLKIAYTLQTTTDESENSILKGRQIVYTPKELLNVNCVFNIEEYYLGVLLNYTSFVYSIADNSKESVIPSNFITNLFFSKTITLGEYTIELRTEALNIFNEKYEIIKNYPMPQRAFKIGASFQL